ncbi:hypothetical protein D3C78_704260 [compost metagenome]
MRWAKPPYALSRSNKLPDLLALDFGLRSQQHPQVVRKGFAYVHGITLGIIKACGHNAKELTRPGQRAALIIKQLEVARVVQHIQAPVTFTLAHCQQRRALQGYVEQAPTLPGGGSRQFAAQLQAHTGQIKRLRRVQVQRLIHPRHADLPYRRARGLSHR